MKRFGQIIVGSPADVIVTALYEAAVQNGWKTNKNRVKRIHPDVVRLVNRP